jgi:hypothetical protein
VLVRQLSIDEDAAIECVLDRRAMQIDRLAPRFSRAQEPRRELQLASHARHACNALQRGGDDEPRPTRWNRLQALDEIPPSAGVVRLLICEYTQILERPADLNTRRIKRNQIAVSEYDIGRWQRLT